MKTFTLKNIALFSLLLAIGCKQETINLVDPPPVEQWVQCPSDASAGTADFTKFVAIGSSYTAGFQAGALFNEGQNNSLPAILNKQFACVGAGTFHQPDINTATGFNIFISPNPDAGGHIKGRFLLQYNNTDTPTPTAQLSALDALPDPTYNPGFIYTATTSAVLNNFGVEAITLGQYLISNTGNWADPNPAHGFSPFYARFASNPGSSTLIGDAAQAGGSFFMFWGGMDDFLLYAAFGGDPTKAPLTNANGGTPADFDFQYGAAVGSLLGSNPNLKGVLVNFPEIFAMPHFTAVPWNALVFTDADKSTIIDPTNAAYAPYNGGLDAAFGGGAISAAERDKRKINFAVGANGMVIEDETLTDLSGFGLPSIRQATSSDIFPLAAGGVIGTMATPGDPSTTWGVGKALTDQYALIPSEIAQISTARHNFNTIIAATAATYSTKLALTDMEGAMSAFVTNKAAVLNGVTLTPNIDPPTGIYSEDGLHPNTRGYAFLSTIIIAAINDKFSAKVPLTNVGLYGATALPIP